MQQWQQNSAANSWLLLFRNVQVLLAARFTRATPSATGIHPDAPWPQLGQTFAAACAMLNRAAPVRSRDADAVPFVEATCPRQRHVLPAVYLPTADSDADLGGGSAAAAAPTGQPTAEATDAFRKRVQQLPSRFVPRPGKPSVECVLCLHIASEIGQDDSVLNKWNTAVLAACYPDPAVVGRDLSGILKVLFPLGLRYVPQREWHQRPQLGTPDCPYNYLITNNAWTSDAGLFLYAHCCIVHVVRRCARSWTVWACVGEGKRATISLGHCVIHHFRSAAGTRLCVCMRPTPPHMPPRPSRPCPDISSFPANACHHRLAPAAPLRSGVGARPPPTRQTSSSPSPWSC